MAVGASRKETLPSLLSLSLLLLLEGLNSKYVHEYNVELGATP